MKVIRETPTPGRTSLLKIFYVTLAIYDVCVFNLCYHINAGLQDEEARGIVSRLRDGKRYLSTDFKLHISTDTPCANHCSVYALSCDEVEYRGTCSHQHNISCDRCSDLPDAILDIQVALSNLNLRYYTFI